MEFTISKKGKNKAQKIVYTKKKNGGHLKWCIISFSYCDMFISLWSADSYIDKLY